MLPSNLFFEKKKIDLMEQTMKEPSKFDHIKIQKIKSSSFVYCKRNKVTLKIISLIETAADINKCQIEFPKGSPHRPLFVN